MPLNIHVWQALYLKADLCLCLGYGFVDFESPESAQKACQHLTLQGTQASFAKVSNKVRDLLLLLKFLALLQFSLFLHDQIISMILDICDTYAIKKRHLQISIN